MRELMPNLNLVARTSGFKANCGLEALAHTIIENIHKIDPIALDRLRAAFNAYTQATPPLSHAEFITAITGLDSPVHRGLVLTPALRAMLTLPDVLPPDMLNAYQKALSANEEVHVDDIYLMHLANVFKIKVDSFTSCEHYARTVVSGGFRARLGLRSNKPIPVAELDVLNAKIKEETERLRKENYDEKNHLGQFSQPYPTVATLKLWNSGGHFERILNNPDQVAAHNRYYSDRQYIYSTIDAEPIRKRIQVALNNRSIRNPNLSELLTQYEREALAKSSASTTTSSSTDNWGFTDVFKDFGRSVSNAVKGMGDSLSGIAKGIGEKISTAGSAAKSAITEAGAFASSMKELTSLGNSISNAFSGMDWKKITAGIGTLFNQLFEQLAPLLENLMKSITGLFGQVSTGSKSGMTSSLNNREDFGGSTQKGGTAASSFKFSDNWAQRMTDATSAYREQSDDLHGLANPMHFSQAALSARGTMGNAGSFDHIRSLGPNTPRPELASFEDPSQYRFLVPAA